MKKVVFIAGLSHSGSTLANLLLAEDPRFIALGEVATVLASGPMGRERSQAIFCSCGSTMAKCEFWGAVAEQVPTDRTLTLAEQYKIILDTFERVYDEQYVFADSSKYVEPLEVLCQMPDVDLKVVHVIKDVRAFVISQIDNARRKGRAKFGRGAAYWFWVWYLGNKRIQRRLSKYGVNALQVGYEELCLDSDVVMEKISEFLGGEFKPSISSLKGRHILRGNRRATDRIEKEGGAIRYDNRWFYRNEWVIPAALFPNIMRYNRKGVYGSTNMIESR